MMTQYIIAATSKGVTRSTKTGRAVTDEQLLYSREWVTTIESVCATGKSIPPFTILL